MAYSQTNSMGVKYYLHRKEATLRGGTKRTIYFFASVAKHHKGEPCDLPEELGVKENPVNGLLLTYSKAKAKLKEQKANKKKS